MTDHEIMLRIANSQAVMNMNYDDLNRLHDALANPEFCLKITASDRGTLRLHRDCLRYVMNYMSAWYALKSLLQAQMKPGHLRIKESFRDAYLERVDSDFIKNDLCMFFESCRNVFIHEGIPFATSQLNFGQGVLLKLLVDVDQITKSDYFSKGKSYVEHTQTIDIYDVCSEHFLINCSFYEWFNANIQYEPPAGQLKA